MVSQRFPGRTFVLWIFLIFMLFSWCFSLIIFNEAGATWQGIPVLLCAIPIIGVLLAILYGIGLLVAGGHGLDFFDRVPTYMIVIFICYYLLSLFGGTYFTHAHVGGGELQRVHAGTSYADDDYRYSHSGGFVYSYILVNHASSGSTSSSSSSSSCKNCGTVIAVAALILALIMLIIAACVIQYFWIVATLFAIIVLVFFLQREYQEYGQSIASVVFGD